MLLGDVLDADRLLLPVLGGQLQHGDTGIFGLGGYFHCGMVSVVSCPWSVAMRRASRRKPDVTQRCGGQRTHGQRSILLDAGAVLVLDNVQAAFLLACARPAAGAV